jgi:hypothetical protein
VSDEMSRYADPDDADPPTADVEFPALEAGLTVLELDERLVHGLQALVIDHLLTAPGRALWLDAAGYARTTVMRELAPSRRLLNRIEIARTFTAYQQRTLIQTAGDRLDAGDGPASLLVCPALCEPVRRSDADGHRRRELRLTNHATLAGLARDRDLPVLVTRQGEARGEIDRALDRTADRVIRLRHTDQGPRFEGDGVETLLYAAGPGGTRQTTLQYWVEVLSARAEATIEPAGAATGA